MRNPFTTRRQLNFREDLVNELLREYMNHRNIQLQNQPTQRIIPGMHRLGRREQKHCSICSTKENRKTTVFYCVECDESVCVIDCFYRLHTNWTVYSRNKSRNI